MEKVVKISSLKDPQNDFVYWSTKSYTDRLNAIETLRLQFSSINKDVQPRLQRVCRVTHQKQG